MDAPPTDTRVAVQMYLDRGLVVFPVPYGAKAAATPEWQDPQRKWTANDFKSEDNIALRLDRVIDIDPDCHEARRACARLFAARQTASYKRHSSDYPTHYLFEAAGKSRQIKYTDVTGETLVEIRYSSNQYSIAPPSYLAADDKRHKPADILEWVVPLAKYTKLDFAEIELRTRTAATIALLARHWPENGELTNQHVTAGLVAGTLCHLGLEDDANIVGIIEEAATLAGDDNVKDRVRFARDTVAKYRAGKAVQGGPSLRKELGEDVVGRIYEWWGYSELDQKIDILNEKHAVLFGQHGKLIVMTEYYEDDQLQLRFTDYKQMALLYPEPVVVGTTTKGQDITKPLGNLWVFNKRRRYYEGIELAPHGSINPKYYNMWRGFSVEPKKGDWSLFQQHLSVVSNGDENCAKYILAWMAETVQHPERPIGIALAFRGKQGTGKSTFAKWFGSLFGPHFAHLDSEYHLTGHFNAHLHNKIVILADEAVWAGGKSGLGALKRLITEDTLNIERKGFDVISVKNLLHMMVASNEDWVVPVGFDNRRFAVFDVSDEHQNDFSFFKGVSDQLFRNEGLSAMLYDLLEYRGNVDLHDIPDTEALADQQRASADMREEWWIERLEEKAISENQDCYGDTDWPREITKKAMFMDFEEFVNKYHRFARRKYTESQVGKFLKNVIGLEETRKNKDKNRYWLLPTWDECVRRWEEKHKEWRGHTWGHHGIE